jgi:hypothetical protein
MGSWKMEEQAYILQGNPFRDFLAESAYVALNERMRFRSEKPKQHGLSLRK